MPIYHVKTATTPDNPAEGEILPSHWNSAHSMSLVGSEVIGAFSNDPIGNVSFSTNGAGFIYGNANVTAAPSPVNVTGFNGSSVNAQTIAFGNANGLSLGVSTAAGGATITGSYTVPVQTVQTQASGNVAGAGFTTAGNVGMSGTNNSAGFSLSITQSNQAFSAPGGSSTFQTLNFVNTNGVSFSNSNGSVYASVQTNYQSAGAYLTTARASNDAVGLNSAVSNATATINSSGFSFDGRGYAGTGTSATNASVTLNSNGLQISVAAPGAGGGVALYDGANSISSGTARFSNANGVSFGFNGQTITASIAAVGGAQTGISGIQVSNTTYTQGTVTFQNANGISFGSSGAGGISASYTVPTVPTAYVSSVNGLSGAISLNVGSSLSSSVNGSSITFGLASNITTALQSAGAYLTTQSAQAFSASGGSSAFQTLNFANSNGFTFSNSAGSVIGSYSVPSVTQFFSATNTTFNGANISGSMTLNTNGLQLSLSAGAGGGGAESNAIQLLGANTSGNTTASGSTIGWSGLNLTLSGTNASQVVISAPATSSLSATGQVSISVNGSTISIGVPNAATQSGFNPYADLEMFSQQIGAGTLIFDPNYMPNVQFDRVLMPVYFTGGATTASQTISMYVGLYTRNASTLSLVGSTSGSFSMALSSNTGAYISSYSGMRMLSIGSTATIAQGQYWLGVMSLVSTSSASVNVSQMVISNAALPFLGEWGVTTNASRQFTLGQGIFSTSTAGIPSSVAFSAIRGSDSNGFRAPIVLFASSTV